jgi:hypothetical protein
MPTESLSILYLGIGLLFVVLMGLAVQTIAGRSTNLRVDQKKDAVNLLRSELDALKADLNALHLNLLRPELDVLKADLNALHLNLLRPELDDLKADLTALKTKLEMVTDSTKLNEHPSLVPVPSTASQLLLDDTWSQGNTWSRDEPVSDASIVPTVDQSSPGDTWTRDERISDFSVAPTVSRSTNEDTWTRDDSTPHSPDWGKGATLLTGVVFSQRETPHSGRTQRIA